MRRLWLATAMLALTACAQAPTGDAPPLSAPSGRELLVRPAALVVTYPSIPKRPSAIPRSSQKYRVYAFKKIHYKRAQMRCLDQLWIHESHWNPRAGYTSSSYGIPQAYPGRKMASKGADWRTNGKTQIRWGLSYIRGRYGSPCAAWASWQVRSPHWY